LFATVGMLFWARVVDRTGAKIYNLIAALLLGAAGLALSVMFTSLVPALICLAIALVGTISARTIFYTIPQSFLTGAAAAGGLAFINSVGAFGGFVGPYLVGFLKDAIGSFNAGMLGMAVILLVATGLAAPLKLMIRNA
jgi:nitrate/nitrite transporter NarK